RLPFAINAYAVFRGIADLENGVRFKECARQEETEERYEPRAQKGCHRAPHQATALLIGRSVARPNRGDTGRGGRLRGSDCGCADVFICFRTATRRHGCGGGCCHSRWGGTSRTGCRC